jgi:hypothetical protein
LRSHTRDNGTWPTRDKRPRYDKGSEGTKHTYTYTQAQNGSPSHDARGPHTCSANRARATMHIAALIWAMNSHCGRVAAWYFFSSSDADHTRSRKQHGAIHNRSHIIQYTRLDDATARSRPDIGSVQTTHPAPSRDLHGRTSRAAKWTAGTASSQLDWS